MAHTCSGCTTTWTGLRMAHCAGCHHTFSTVVNFDRHRSWGSCRAPESMKTTRRVRTPGGQVQTVTEPVFKLNRHGVWVGAQQRDTDG